MKCWNRCLVWLKALLECNGTFIFIGTFDILVIVSRLNDFYNLQISWHARCFGSKQFEHFCSGVGWLLMLVLVLLLPILFLLLLICPFKCYKKICEGIFRNLYYFLNSNWFCFLQLPSSWSQSWLSFTLVIDSVWSLIVAFMSWFADLRLCWYLVDRLKQQVLRLFKYCCFRRPYIFIGWRILKHLE